MKDNVLQTWQRRCPQAILTQTKRMMHQLPCQMWIEENSQDSTSPWKSTGNQWLKRMRIYFLQGPDPWQVIQIFCSKYVYIWVAFIWLQLHNNYRKGHEFKREYWEEELAWKELEAGKLALLARCELSLPKTVLYNERLRKDRQTNVECGLS